MSLFQKIDQQIALEQELEKTLTPEEAKALDEAESVLENKQTETSESLEDMAIVVDSVEKPTNQEAALLRISTQQS